MRIFIFILINFLFTSSNESTKYIDRIINNTQKKFELVNDFEVKIKIDLNIPAFRMPQKKYKAFQIDQYCSNSGSTIGKNKKLNRAFEDNRFIEKKIFSINNIYIGFQRIVFGLFIKIVLADNISKFVDEGWMEKIKFN